MDGSEPGQRFSHRVLIAVALVAAALVLLLLVRQVAQILLLVFAGVLAAVGLEGLTQLVRRRTPLGAGAARLVVALVLLVPGAMLGWLFGPHLTDQLAQLIDRLPEALARLREQLQASRWGELLLEHLGRGGGVDWASRAAGFFRSVFGAVFDVLVVAFVGLYLWVNPRLYTAAAVALVPPRHRPRAEQILALQARTLQRWLVGRLASMLVVGLLTGLGLAVLGVPLAVTLGAIAATLSFIPYLGPVLSAAPALLIALLQGPGQVVSVVVLYAAVQLVESYMITPLIQLRAVSLPPAFLISAQLIAGVLAGALGVLLATPLAVVVTVLVQALYIEGVLGERVRVLGE